MEDHSVEESKKPSDKKVPSRKNQNDSTKKIKEEEGKDGSHETKSSRNNPRRGESSFSRRGSGRFRGSRGRGGGGGRGRGSGDSQRHEKQHHGNGSASTHNDNESKIDEENLDRKVERTKATHVAPAAGRESVTQADVTTTSGDNVQQQVNKEGTDTTTITTSTSTKKKKDKHHKKTPVSENEPSDTNKDDTIVAPKKDKPKRKSKKKDQQQQPSSSSSSTEHQSKDITKTVNDEEVVKEQPSVDQQPKNKKKKKQPKQKGAVTTDSKGSDDQAISSSDQSKNEDTKDQQRDATEANEPSTKDSNEQTPSSDQQKKKRKKKPKKEKDVSTKVTATTDQNEDEGASSRRKTEKQHANKKSTAAGVEGEGEPFSKKSSKKKTDRFIEKEHKKEQSLPQQRKQKFGSSVSNRIRHLAHDRSLPIEISEYSFTGSRSGRSHRPPYGASSSSTSYNFRSDYSNISTFRKHEDEPLVLSFNDGQVDQFHFASDDLVTDHHHHQHHHHHQQHERSDDDRVLSETIIERRPPPPPPSSSTSKKDFSSRKGREGQHHQQQRGGGGSRAHHYMHPDDRNPQNRRTLFSPYMSSEAMIKEIEEGKLIRGNLRINKRNRSDAYVTSDSLDHDIFIFGQRDRNRALEGDIVAVRLLDVEKIWHLKKEKMRKRDAEKAAERAAAERAAAATAAAKEEEEEKVEDETNPDKSTGTEGGEEEEVEEEEIEVDETIDSFDEEADKSKPKYCGEIVGILDRAKDQKFAGILYVERPNNTNSKDQQQQQKEKEKRKENNDNEKAKQARFVWFKPTDKRTPYIAIPVERAPLDVFQKADEYENTLLTATITKWPITGQHPIGQITGYLGPIGMVVSETQAILADNQVKDVSFSNDALGGLPKTPWKIPQIEYKTRRDLRETRIFTIDPATAKDLDDAVHVKALDDGHFEVGVHIADVSYFLRKYSPLDTEARERGTSTYLVDRVIPMLPSLLCEELCSLNPSVERLAFSVIWKMDSTGNIVDTWFGRTIIKSCAKLAYDDAQSVIDGNGLPKTAIIMGQSRNSVEEDITHLYKLSKHMRKRRFENGALSINSIRLCFKLNEAGEPEDVWIYELKEANRLIEEFMLCANMSVAQKICNRFPDEALLRRHEPPIERRLTEFLKLSEELGYELDGSSAGNLQASFNAIEDEHVRSVLTVMAIKPMQRAKYFCTGTLDVAKYTHYALNVPLYTHFTSPIRRYADVIVHRQLEAALRDAGSCGYNKKEAQEIALQCNRCRDGAKNAQDQNIELYLAHYLNKLTRTQGSIIRPAIVVQVLSDAFDIIVPEYGIEKRIHTDKLPLHRHVFDASELSMDVYWKKGEMVTTFEKEETEGEENIPHDSVMPGEKEDVKDTKQYVEDDDVDDPPFPGIPIVKSDDVQQVASSEDINESTGMQRFKVFTTFDVLIQVNMQRSPPIINVYPINPFAQRP